MDEESELHALLRSKAPTPTFRVRESIESTA
jgi:hypothetical protein